MDFNTILVVLLRWVHVGAAAVWFGGGLYAYMLLRADVAGDTGVAVRYNAQLSRLSKVGLLMPIGAMGTAVGGLVLYILEQAWSGRSPSTFGGIVFHLGVLLGIAATVHGFREFGGPAAQQVQKDLEASVNPDGTVNMEKGSAYIAYMNKMAGVMNLHFGLVAGAFLLMTAGTAIP